MRGVYLFEGVMCLTVRDRICTFFDISKCVEFEGGSRAAAHIFIVAGNGAFFDRWSDVIAALLSFAVVFKSCRAGSYAN